MVRERGRTGIVALDGPSGAGKTTVGRALAALLDARLIPEAYVRLVQRPSLRAADRDELWEIESRLLREEGERWREAAEAGSHGQSIVLDTATLGPLSYSWGLREGVDPALDIFPEIVHQARHQLRGGRWGVPDLTIYLDVPEDVALARSAMDPRGHPRDLRARHATVARWERVLYLRELPRRSPGRFTSAVGDGPPERVARAIAEKLEQLGTIPPASREDAERALGAFEGSGPAGPPSAPTKYARP
jgi:thymidylate kinase